MTDGRPEVLVFGGSFNPFHNGHLTVAENVKRHYHIESVRLLPTVQTTLNVADPQLLLYHRVRMLQELTRHFHWLELELCEVIMRLDSAYLSLSWQTKHLRSSNIGFILGEDQFMRLQHWKNPDRLIPMIHWIVAPRLDGREDVGSERLRRQERLINDKGGSTHILESEAPDISSTRIRALLRRSPFARKQLAAILPAPIFDYLKVHHVYR